ncbi:hypothetical protein RD792_017750 [Penstemon davidsonii]|uniref:Uncharacterized protein n=1 Tax=Penstemon davidsonii TaxID=160366 RepID=A0ABR0DWJ0_9LAMI|nr:hypothetical protein RD792_017750 [Penstemon davidsonii]
MAPRACVAVFKVVFTKEYGLFASDVMAAIYIIIDDGFDVLSLSIVSSPPLYHDPVGIPTFVAMKKFIFVSNVAGNSDPYLKNIFRRAHRHQTVGAGVLIPLGAPSRNHNACIGLLPKAGDQDRGHGKR